MRPDIRHARQGYRSVHLTLELRQGHARSPLIARLKVHDGFRHVQTGWIGRGVRAGYLCRDISDFGKALQHFVLPLGIFNVLRQRDARVGDGHEHNVSLVEGRHKFAAYVGSHHNCANEEDNGDTEGDGAVIERPGQRWTIQPLQKTHDRVLVFRMELAAEQEHAKNGYQRECNGCCAHHREGFGKSQWMEKFSLLSGKRKHRHKRQNDNRHRKKRRTANQLRSSHHGLEDAPPIARIDAFEVSKRIFGHDNACIHQDSNRDGNARQRHHIRGHMRVVHQQERTEHGNRQRYGDDQDAAEMHQEDDVCECDQDDLFDQRVT